jgi:GAF domain-containing protein
VTDTDRRVREVFIELMNNLVTDYDIIEFLERLAARCAELLDLSACGVLLADQYGMLNLVAASGQQARLAELTQIQDAEGPCVEAYHSGEPVQCSNLSEIDPRWPMFTAAAWSAGFGAVQALPMRLRDERVGVLNLFCRVPGALDDDEVALGQAFADAAAVGIVHQRALARSEAVTEQLQLTLHSRIVIEQAKGFLAERLGLTVERAFILMRTFARENHRKLTDVAADIAVGRVEFARPPDAEPVPAAPRTRT